MADSIPLTNSQTISVCFIFGARFIEGKMSCHHHHNHNKMVIFKGITFFQDNNTLQDNFTLIHDVSIVKLTSCNLFRKDLHQFFLTIFHQIVFFSVEDWEKKVSTKIY